MGYDYENVRAWERESATAPAPVDPVATEPDATQAREILRDYFDAASSPEVEDAIYEIDALAFEVSDEGVAWRPRWNPTRLLAAITAAQREGEPR